MRGRGLASEALVHRRRWGAHATRLAVALLLAGCASFPRLLVREADRSSAMRERWMDAGVLAPSDLRADEALPLVVFLHGEGDDAAALDRHGASAELVRGWAAGTLPRAIVLAPEGDLGFWANWYDGTRRYEDWVVDELMPRVARRYHTRDATLGGAHLVGVAMGGDAALRWAIHRRGRWASVTSLSAPITDTRRRVAFLEDRVTNIAIPSWHVFGPPTPHARHRADDPWLAFRRAEDLDARLVLGWSERDEDVVRASNARFHEHLAALSIPHAIETVDEERGWPSARPLLLRALARVLDVPL